jgi:CRP-like cAMP-binding protein
MRTRVDAEVRERLRQLLRLRAPALGLTPEALDKLLRSAVLERWASGDEVAIREAGGPPVGFVVVGAVKLVCEMARGRRVGVAFVPPGGLFGGEWPAEAGAPRTELRALAHDPLGTIIAVWPPRTIAEVLEGLPPSNVLQLLGATWRVAMAIVRQKCHLLGLCDRVLAALVTLARDFGRPHPDGLRIELRLTHQDLAGAAVGSRANVTRALEELRAAGLVIVDQHRLVVTARGLAAFERDVPRDERWAAAGGR